MKNLYQKRNIKKMLLYIVLFSFQNIYSQIITFPDLNFKTRLLQSTANTGPVYFIASGSNGQNIAIDSNNNSEIEISEAQAVYRLTVQYAAITDLSGIEYFSNLIDLNCADNLLTSLDVSALSNLENFRCDRNDISYLNITGLTNLRTFWYGGNNLPSIDANNNPNIVHLGCDGNNITSLDVSGLPYLSFLVCGYNNINTLDLSNQNNLIHLSCPFNLLTELDISKMINYGSMQCNNNPLININMKNGHLFDYQNLTQYNMNFSNCPNLINICVDDFNINSIQTKVLNYGYTNCDVNTDCNLSNEYFDFDEQITFYPNPVKNVLHIESNLSSSEYLVSIYNNIGQLVLISKSTKQIDVSSLKKGVYIINITKNNKSVKSKLLKD